MKIELRDGEPPDPRPPATADAHGQHKPGLLEQQMMSAVPSITPELLGAGISTALAGLGASQSNITLSQIAIASILENFSQQNRRLSALEHELKEERVRSRDLESALTDMRSRADIAETRLSEADSSSILRDVMLTVGGVILGASTVLYEKLGIPATIVGVGVGAALVVAVVKSRKQRRGA